jgi:hypothetical protein
LSSGFGGWAARAATFKIQRALLMRVVARMGRVALSAAFQGWSARVTLRRQQEVETHA